MRDLTVLILAGGDGKRIGGAKPLRMLQGSTLRQHAFRLARRWTDVPVIAVREASEGKDRGVRQVIDRAGLAGPLAGLAAGLAEARGQANALMLVIPIDMPFLPDDLPDRLRTALDTHPDAGCAMVGYEGRGCPVCSLWRVDRTLDAIEDRLAAEDSSLLGLARQVGFECVEWDDASERQLFFNINTRADLARAEIIAA